MKTLRFIIICCPFLLLSCLSPAPKALQTQPAQSTAVNTALVESELKILLQGNISGKSETEILTVQDQAQFARLWRNLNSAASELPIIDFSQDYVVFAFMGQRKTGGYYYEPFLQNLDSKATPQLLLQESMPGRNEVVTMATTTPFIVVQVTASTIPLKTNVAKKVRK